MHVEGRIGSATVRASGTADVFLLGATPTACHACLQGWQCSRQCLAPCPGLGVQSPRSINLLARPPQLQA